MKHTMEFFQAYSFGTKDIVSLVGIAVCAGILLYLHYKKKRKS